MTQIAVRDQLTLRMRGEPVLALTKELRNLIVADIVMLVVIENRNQDIQMRQEFAEPDFATESHSKVSAEPPLRVGIIQRMRDRFDGVAKRLEEPPRERLATATGDDRQMRLQWQAPRSKIGALFAAAGHRGSQDVANRDAHER